MSNVDQLITLLKENNLTLGSVESMTGGGFAFDVTSVNGSSKVFRGGLVTYASELKTKLVNANKDKIDKYGVVSSIVAEEMSKGGCESLDVDICVSVTGNAGPKTCEGDAQVGDYYVGLCFKGNISSYYFHFDGSREGVRKDAINNMINVILKKIDK